VLDTGVGTDAAREATMTDLWMTIWLIVATLVLLLVAGGVGIMLLVQIAEIEGLLS
jgi:hypothetical protein